MKKTFNLVLIIFLTLFLCSCQTVSKKIDKNVEKETKEHIEMAMELELAYAREVLPTGILGLNSDMFIDYVQFVADRRLTNLGMESPFGDAQNTFPWLSEIIDLEK